MAMTLRLDEQTSAQLRALSQKTGRSQQQLVHEAVREFVGLAVETIREKKLARREALRRANVACPVGVQSELFNAAMAVPAGSWASDEDLALWRSKGLVVHPPVRPVRELGYLIAPPPGGVMEWLDREDRS